mmetsp:Transcript_39212/g.109084  ORF Transcript_39212/g.109084 Transcript_39212/m.109084 type:complete len:381 (+) Transcript_39212:50-1192(+)
MPVQLQLQLCKACPRICTLAPAVGMALITPLRRKGHSLELRAKLTRSQRLSALLAPAGTRAPRRIATHTSPSNLARSVHQNESGGPRSLQPGRCADLRENLAQPDQDGIHGLPAVRARHHVRAAPALKVLIHEHALQHRRVPRQAVLPQRPEEGARGNAHRGRPAARVQVEALAEAAFPQADREVPVRTAHVQVHDDGDPALVDDKVQAPLALQAPGLLDFACCGDASLGQALGGRGGGPAVPVVDHAVARQKLIRQQSAGLTANHVERRRHPAPRNELFQDGSLPTGELEGRQLRLRHIDDDAVATGGPRWLQHQTRAVRQLAAQLAHGQHQLRAGGGNVTHGPASRSRAGRAERQGLAQGGAALLRVDVRMQPGLGTA